MNAHRLSHRCKFACKLGLNLPPSQLVKENQGGVMGQGRVEQVPEGGHNLLHLLVLNRREASGPGKHGQHHGT